MTRATLLHVLDRPTALGAAEVRELEQLAQAFPYCQTAHLLLAKAAHDQGTMLAGQRLRRAATYAADRALLRRLIEQVEPAEPAEPAALPTPAPAAETEISPAALAAEPLASSVAETSPPAPAPAEPRGAPASETTAVPVAELVALTAEAAHVSPAAPSQLLAEEAPAETALDAPILATADAFVAEPLVHVEAVQAGIALGYPVSLVDPPAVDIPTAEPAAAQAPTPVAEAVEAAGEDLPPQAPAIRPPVEVGEARFEFGLAEPPPASRPTYELPGLVDEWAAAAVTLSLGSLEPLTEPATADAPTAAALTPAAFTGDEAVGYAFGESSRLGFSMQLLEALTDRTEPMGASSLAAASQTQPPAAPLPPPGVFFEPDALLCAHWAAHCPPAPALPSSLDLINNFLRRQPRLTRPAMLPPAPTHQPDLSVRSTRAEPELASESLARILVRQGKTARAIEIYEKLMVKQPEKMAYFAAQIQSLHPPA